MADPIVLPELFFRARCKAEGCRALLGGFHVPCREAMIVYICPKCHATSVFRVEPYQVRAAVAGPLVGDDSVSPPTQRRR